jgi:glycosyltransferase involved in cell wall biosynthesis
MSARVAVCTIIAKNYLPFARILMSSIREHNPEVLRIVILVDQVDKYFDPAKEDFDIILSEQLEIPKSHWFHFKYSLLELSTAVKPYALDFLFHAYGLQKLIYLDPDIKVYDSLGLLFRELDRHCILLTPHLTGILEDELRPSELDILRAGVYNLGFIGLSAGQSTFPFLKWWQQKLYDHCVVDLARGLFVDQRWMDLAPGLFPGVGIIREPGYNVAYWNLGHRRVEKCGDAFTVNGNPLYFFHFSGFDPDDPELLSKHQNRHRLSNLGDGRGLVLQYREELLAQGFLTCRKWPYAYGHFRNGFPIPDTGRPAHHEYPGIMEEVEDPFSDAGFEAFVHVWNQPVVGPDGERSAVTRLAYRIYRTRADVQAAMPDVFGVHQLRFLNWVLSSGQAEHGLHEVFLAPVWDAAKAAGRNKEGIRQSCAPSLPPVCQRLLAGAAADSIWQTLSKDGAAPTPSNLNELIENGHAGLRLTRLARLIYESRPDLQRFFPDPCGRHGLRFLLWLLSYGRQEYGLDDQYMTPLRNQWHAVLSGLGAPLRLWYETVLSLTLRSAQLRPWVGRQLSFVRCAVAAERWKLRRAVRRSLPGGRATAGNATAALAHDNGVTELAVNLVGNLCTETGVGESARAAGLAMQATGVPFYARAVSPNGPYRSQDFRTRPVAEGFAAPISIFHINADQTPLVFATLDQDLVKDKYNIGYWAWELEEFPDRWLSSFGYYREVWVPSTFCQDAVARRSPIPVIRIPHAIQVETPLALSRSDFGLPEDKFIFVTVFDMMSVFERKNPLAVVDAFRQVCQSDEGAHLVLKVHNSDWHRDKLDLLQERAAGLPVTIIDRTLDRSDLNALLAACDCLVSLHRSEGFGLTLAEAMYLEKPVIATAYSGNVDFMKPGNSFLVGYRLQRVGKGCEPYDENSLWADPSLADAMDHMRAVLRNRVLREQTARNGRDYVRRHLCPEVVGQQIRNRLQYILQRMAVVSRNGSRPA